jgi:Flp pilus assembly protein TadD
MHGRPRPRADQIAARFWQSSQRLVKNSDDHMWTWKGILFAVTILVLWLVLAPHLRAAEQQVCDVGADYALGRGDYPEAIRLHTEVVRKHPDNALAYYHLGFAEGMMGNKAEELREYEHAAATGLSNWDLFLNLGLAQFENGDLAEATASLRRAVLLGQDHYESHFNLALVYERRGLLANAEREMLASLQLNPGQPDARNSLGVIYAEEGKTVRASLVWRELVREVPNYEPAHTNLALLGKPGEVGFGERAAVLPMASAVKVLQDEH